MSEMVERVARAIEDHMRACDSGAYIKGGVIDGNFFDFRNIASAAIRAMRVPSDEMLCAAYEIAESCGLENQWREMIDVALKEKP